MTAAKLIHVVRAIHNAALHYRTNHFSIFLRFLRLFFQERFSRTEIVGFGLADPRMPDSELAKYVSTRRLNTLRTQYNPRSYTCLTEDKSIFYPFCTASGISVPKLYAIFDPLVGWSSNGSVLSSRRDWERFFDEFLGGEFIVKPATGVHGRAVSLFRRTDKGFIDSFGKRYTTSELYDLMRLDTNYQRWVLQERLANHPDLVRLSDTRSLQTTRLVSFIGQRQTPVILFAAQKIIGGQSVTDNFHFGQSGNMVASVRLESGMLDAVVMGEPSGLGLTKVVRHPKTGVSFEGFQLPFWGKACELVTNAASKCWPIRTIGWDVALTPTGPVIVEGNMWWDPEHHNAHRQMNRFLHVHGKEEKRNVVWPALPGEPPR